MDGKKQVVPGDRVRCLRLNEERSAEEHLDCLYCNGKAADVATGDRARFCDFQPGADPVAFGFPEGSTRSKQ